MTMPIPVRRALVKCARVDHPDDEVLIKPGARKATCSGCGVAVWISPSTLDLEARGVQLTIACNSCSNEFLRSQVARTGVGIDLAIAPKALLDETPADRRRRNELEAHGFHQLTNDDLPTTGVPLDTEGGT